MKVRISISRIAAAAVVVAVGGRALAQTGTPAGGPRPSILVIDRQAIAKNSKLGQDIQRQIGAYVNKLRADLGPQGQQLQSQMQALQVLPSSPDHDKKMQALQVKEANFRQKVQSSQSLIQGGEMAAQQRYTAELTDVANAIMRERGAYAVVDKSTVFTSVGGIDITQTAIQRLDAKITTFKVPLVNPPPGTQMPSQ
jgi:outer membrane protein